MEYLRRKPDGENCKCLKGNSNIQRAIVFQGGGALGAYELAHINIFTEKQEKKARMVDYLI